MTFPMHDAPTTPLARPLRAALLAALLALMPAMAAAQAPPPDEEAPEVVPAAPAVDPGRVTPSAKPVVPTPVFAADTTVVLPPLAEVRPREEITRELESTSYAVREVEDARLAAQVEETRWKTRAEVKKLEVEALKKRQKLAKKEGRDSDASRLDDERKRAEAVQKYYEKLKSAFAALAEAKDAESQYVRARAEVCRAEIRLFDHWASGEGSRGGIESRKLELALLEWHRERAGRMSDLGSKQKSLSEKRKEVIEAWAQVLG